jgi:hypothetical protein
MPLPADWVEAIFTKLTLVYGQRFLAQYTGLQPEHVKGTWARELHNVGGPGIKHALEHLPADHPPNCLQFRSLCFGGPVEPTKVLPAPKASPERVSAALARMASLRGQQRDPRAWAHRLKAREAAGEHLSITQRTMWRAALRASLDTTEEMPA